MVEIVSQHLLLPLFFISSLHLRIILVSHNSWYSVHFSLQRVEGSRIPEQTSHALFQLTGALRNVAGEEEIFPQFVSTGAVNELCRAMELFSSDLDVISNISRTLRYSR